MGRPVELIVAICSTIPALHKLQNNYNDKCNSNHSEFLCPLKTAFFCVFVYSVPTVYICLHVVLYAAGMPRICIFKLA